MGKRSEEKEIYAQIQKKLFYIIPEKWESVYLYASFVDLPQKRPTGEMYFYYFPKGIIKKKPVNCYEIPNAFNIDEDAYMKLIVDLYHQIKHLREVWILQKKKKWTNLTISIEHFQFKVEYDYQDLVGCQFDSYERHVIWRYEYLKPDIKLFSRKDRKVIEHYLQYQETNQWPRKELYTEGMYAEPVNNIVDFEKMLSVEEAIAQAEREEVPKEKKKNRFLKKKKIIEDIIEIDEEDESVNNQILNWKKK